MSNDHGLQDKILVMGENRVVTEFADCDDIGSSNYKSWMKRHQDDILCSATYLPQILITASFSGELVFWRLETGQPYGMYNVANPGERIKQQFTGKQTKEKAESKILRPKSRVPQRSRYCYSASTEEPKNKYYTVEYNSGSSDANNYRVSVNAMICFTSRPVHPQIGTLMVALDDGEIQMWSNHPGGGYLSQFKCIHSLKDYVVSLCTDNENKYLFTGHMAGYIKTWHMVNYGIPEEDHVHICMPKLRLQFPFMWHDYLLGRAKRMHRSNIPLLLNSYKAHLKPVTGMVYIDRVKIIISCSSDGSARIWTLGGRYMGTLGTFKPWTFISPTAIADDTRQYPLPADIQRCPSFTTFRVMTGGTVEKRLTKKQQKQQYEQMGDESERVYGKRINLDSVLGKHFKLPARGFHHYDIMLDTSLPDVPIYSEMVMPMPETIKRPPTPELMKNLKIQKRITMSKMQALRNQ